MKYCTKCGTQLTDDSQFCSNCGAPQGMNTNTNTTYTTGTTQSTAAGPTVMDSITASINNISGGSGAVKAPLGKIFSEVFNKHTNEEAEEIFACGTPKTTPKLTEVETSWPTPWLFGRIIGAGLIAFILLYVCAMTFDNPIGLLGLIIVGSFLIPIATIVFFFEFNVPRNISLFSVIKTFLVGGCASLLFALALFDIFPAGESTYGSAIVVGVVEEIAKAFIVYYFLKKEQNANYLSNGLLIGSAVGAGFAAFESAGYALNFLLIGGSETMMETIVVRAFLCIGGHVAWAAVAGYALMLSKKDRPLASGDLMSGTFWRLLIIPIALHAIWDMPIEFGAQYYLPQILLTLAIWIVLFVLLNNCLKQVANEINRQNAMENQAE